MCEAAITATEVKLSIPKGLLHAIGTVESGHWPWIINVGGEDRTFASKADAVAATEALLAAGVRSIDVGCVQVNLMWHPNAFASVEDAFDPATNVAYGGRFLRELYASLGSWDAATGAYHSQAPDRAEPYRQMVMARWLGLPVPPRMAAVKAWNTNADVYGSWPPRGAQFAAMPPSGFAFRCCGAMEKTTH
ncbi:MAG: lytic transglycosylase domain-containing protein [Acidisphaera sp.]|nr:lytic transglycosylase domain-containing protein [Acidisphaera sp.]